MEDEIQYMAKEATVSPLKSTAAAHYATCSSQISVAAAVCNGDVIIITNISK